MPPIANSNSDTDEGLSFTSPMADQDDWRGVIDRKQKKRIQNRVAQRSYRRRMKARMAELQQKLHGYDHMLQAERNRQEAAPSRENEDRTDFYANCEDIHLSVNGDADDGMSNGGESYLGQHATHDEYDFDREPLPSDTQLNSFFIMEKEVPQTDPSMDKVGQPSSQGHDQGHMKPLSPATVDDLEDCQDIISPVLDEAWDTPVSNDQHAHVAAEKMSIPPPSDTSSLPLPSNLETQYSMEKRVDCIIEYIKCLGFDNADAFVTTYYSSSLESGSVACNEQRLSRNRRLPRVISNLAHSATDWTMWEQRGFNEELLKATETLLTSEIGAAGADIKADFTRFLDEKRSNGDGGECDTILSLRNKIQSQLPNIWAMIMALQTCDRSTDYADCSDLFLLAVVIISRGGRMADSKVMELLRLCSCT